MTMGGSRSRATTCWWLPEDVQAVGDAIANALPAGRWRCSQPGPAGLHPVHLHADIAEAMACGGTQAFFPLPAGASESASGTEVQLLHSRNRDDASGRYLDAGRLAVRWFEHLVTPEDQAVLVEQTALAWKALRRATLPAKIRDAGGRVTGGMRIGPAAKTLHIELGVPLRRITPIDHWLVDP